MAEKPSGVMTMTLQSDREVVLTRVFDAPRELVFKAHTQPEHVARWWGQRRSTLSVCEIDLRPGGAWRFVERAADGNEFPFKGVYQEIVPPEQLVYTFIFDVEPYSNLEVIDTMTLTERDGKTTLTVSSLYPSVEARDGMIASGMEQGAAESYDRLAEHLDELQQKVLVITRVFDAPRELVFKAWTDPELMAQWWGPKDFTTPACKIDLRVGGKYLFCMRSPDGQDYWGTGVYREIVPPERLVYTDSFADAEGNVVPATHYGMSADFPMELEVTVTFEEYEGKTTMTLRHVGIPAGEMSDLTGAGWNESFDKLAVALAKA